jgi:hypothetical protein
MSTQHPDFGGDGRLDAETRQYGKAMRYLSLSEELQSAVFSKMQQKKKEKVNRPLFLFSTPGSPMLVRADATTEGPQ